MWCATSFLFEGSAGRSHGKNHILRVTGGDLGKDLPVGRVDAVKGLAGQGRFVLSPDKGIGPEFQRLGAISSTPFVFDLA